jgi:gas vesicle protein
MNNGKLIVGILAGVAAGALLGILFAPDKGSETRKKIMRKGKQYMDDLKENMNDIASAYNEEQEEFREPVVSENGSVK